VEGSTLHSSNLALILFMARLNPWMKNVHKKGHGLGRVTPFKIWTPVLYFWNGSSNNFKIWYKYCLWQVPAYG